MAETIPPEVREHLNAHLWPVGFQIAAIKALTKFPIRYVIIDDSGSMASGDGQRLVQTKDKSTMLSCTRWAELVDAMKFHAAFAKAAQAPTEFRLLNSSQKFLVGAGPDTTGYSGLMAQLDQSPGGGTPLCRHVNEIVEQIRAIEDQLKANGDKAVVMIATDGEASDGDISAALKPLHNMPVTVIVRLCTSEENVTKYWNNLDSQLELNMDILDDVCGEAAEISKKNNWLTYGEPMHRLREFGIPVKEFDLLDEAKLTVDQIHAVCAIVFGVPIADIPHPGLSANDFMKYIKSANKGIPEVYNTLTKNRHNWLILNKLGDAVGAKGCTIM